MSGDEPEFLTRADLERIHAQSLHLFGGAAGVRDEGLVHSALASARNVFLYGSGDLFDIAAAYAFHVAEAQAFIDGNKRTAIGTALIFLDMNGIVKRPNNDALYDAMIAVANKQLNKSGLATILRDAGKST
jgi:death on curing protein